MINPGTRRNVRNDISQFWSTIAGGAVNEHDRMITLQNTTWFDSKITTVYNRDCYDEIVEKINSKTRVLIYGSPGIARREFKPIPSITYTRLVNGIPETSYLNRDGSVQLFESNEFTPDYRLSDDVDLSVAAANVLALQVSSDGIKYYKHFSKRAHEAGTSGLAYVMPLLSFEEQCRIYSNVISRVDAQFVYDVFGGNGRSINAIQVKYHPIIKNDIIVEDLMRWYFDYYYNNCDNKEIWDFVIRGLSVIANDPSDMSTINHLAATNDYIWASKFMEILASLIISERNNEMSLKLKSVFINKFRSANPIESLGHYAVTHSDANYILRPLESTASSEYISTMNFKLPIMLLRDVNDIDTLNDGNYGLITFRNSLLIDAVIQPNVLLQFTLSPEYHRGDASKLNDIRNHLSEKDISKHMIVFIIPYENKDRFMYQHDLSDVKQYITFHDPESDSSVI